MGGSQKASKEREGYIMKKYVLKNRKNPKETIILETNDLTVGQMKEIYRDGYEIIAIK